jgi:hypothetical protein
MMPKLPPDEGDEYITTERGKLQSDLASLQEKYRR